MVTERVGPAGRSIAFGWLARGLGLLVSGVVLGLAYGQSIPLVVGLIVGINAVAMIALAWVLARLSAPAGLGIVERWIRAQSMSTAREPMMTRALDTGWW